jgi:hypothetical protein
MKKDSAADIEICLFDLKGRGGKVHRYAGCEY